jgi:2-phospho-L-lactate guanylyltransferase
LRRARSALKAVPLDQTALWAVVPAKEIWRSKQRLAEVLFPDERERLVRAMLRDVLRVLTSVPELADVCVVTRDGALSDFAREWGAEIVAEDEEGDLNAALEVAAAHLEEMGAGGMLVIPGDVPALTVEEISALAQAHPSAPAVTIVPDRRGEGTNALAVSPPRLIPFLFGEGSAERHAEAARDAGVEATILDLPGLRHDVDTELDLDDLAQNAPGTATADVLRSLGRVVAPARAWASEDIA